MEHQSQENTERREEEKPQETVSHQERPCGSVQGNDEVDAWRDPRLSAEQYTKSREIWRLYQKHLAGEEGGIKYAEFKRRIEELLGEPKPRDYDKLKELFEGREV